MKTIKFTLGLIAFLAVITGFTGCIIHEDDYNPPAQHNGYRYVFNEDFNNDRFGWTFDDPYDSAYAFVTQDGLYKFVDYSYNGGYHSAVVPTGANMNNNFLVQARIKSDYAMAVIFGHPIVVTDIHSLLIMPVILPCIKKVALTLRSKRW